MANISDPKAEPERALYANAVPDYWLDDPYEGEMMAVFMYLFGDWAGSSSFVANVTAARDALWTYKRTKLKVRVVGCCWFLLGVVVGCCRLLWVVVGCCGLWLLWVVVVGGGVVVVGGCCGCAVGMVGGD